MTETSHHATILIRRKARAHEEAHHGGVWKIAFADFMTAMMAFFLVLWIVNSTSKEARSSIARYFNPIKLSDTTAARKGLHDAKEGDFDASADSAQDRSKAGMREDKRKPDAKPAAAQAMTANDTAAVLRAFPPVRSGSARIVSASQASRGPGDDAFATIPFAIGSTRTDGDAPVEPSRQAGQPVASMEISASSQRAMELRAAETLERVRGVIETAQASMLANAQPAVEVTQRGRALVVSITDTVLFEMFAVGSSEPNQRAKRLLGIVATALRDVRGEIVVAGHTDMQTFRGGASDNWTLSGARADGALRVLLRSGLDASRIARVEGHGARLARSDATSAAANRRIEILVQPESGAP